jgi:hypothetical protein
MNEEDYVQSFAKRINSNTELNTEATGLGNSHRRNEEWSSGR